MRQIGPYRVEEEIGRGGMATVYRVTNAQGQSYALKLLHAAPTQDKRWGTRFRREFRLLSNLEHTHLIEVHDYGEDEHHAYYVMDYIDGTNLWKFYREQLRGRSTHERLSWLIPLVSQIVSALDYIHHHRVIHKDLKPANILLQHNGENAYLVDFGLARELADSAQYTHPGFMGTLGYSAPELVDRGRFDGRADIYSLGVILYTLLADRRPIQVEGRSFPELLVAIREETPFPIQQLLPDMPAEVGHLIHRCIEKDPSNRYRDTRELWRDLLPMIEHYQRARSEQQALAIGPAPPTMVQPAFAVTEAPSVVQGISLMSTGIIGRSREIELCQSNLTALVNQFQSSALLLYGVPGIGKTFLLEELQSQCERQSSHVHTLRLRPNAAPLGSLTEAIRPLLQQLPPALLESNTAQLLVQYLPGLHDVLPPPRITAGPLTQPVLQLANLLLSMFLQYPPDAHLVWMLDDLHHADVTSKQIISRLLSSLLIQRKAGIMVVATLGYQPEDQTPPFSLEAHPQLEHHYMAVLSEAEETELVTRLLERAPSPKELQNIRAVTRGLPMRTMELVHQGTLLAQSPFRAVEETSVSASEEIMSSVSTALHDLSSFQDALGLTRPDTPEDYEEAGTPLFAEEARITPNDLFDNPYDDEEETQRHPSPGAANALGILTMAMENESTIPAGFRRDTLLPPPPGNKEALFQDDEEEGTLQTTAFNPEQTVMMPVSPARAFQTLISPGPEQTNVQDSQPFVSMLDPNDHDSIHELDSSDELIEDDSDNDYEYEYEGGNLSESRAIGTELEVPLEDPGERTMLQEGLRPNRNAVTRQISRFGTIPDTHNNARTMVSEPLVPKAFNATLIDDSIHEEATSEDDLQHFSESSEELVLIPLLKRRLELLEPNHRLRLTITAFLAEEFTYDELREAIQSPPEEALDLLNVLISLRILTTESRNNEEYYSHLHPVMQQLLVGEVPPSRYPEFAIRAAEAMANNRADYHKTANADLLAMRFAEGGEPVQAFKWQLHAVTQALQLQHNEQLAASLKQLQQILLFWIERGAKIQLLQVLPQLFDPEKQNISLFAKVGQQLLLVGILHMFEAKDTVAPQGQKARGLLRQLLALTPGTSSQAFQSTLHNLSPLLTFARLRIRKKKPPTT